MDSEMFKHWNKFANVNYKSERAFKETDEGKCNPIFANLTLEI